MKFFYLSSFLAVSLLAGCSVLEEDETLAWSVQKLYTEAKEELDGGSYKSSREYYNKLLARYPFGRYAQQTRLDLIWLEYRDQEYDKAIAQADKFLQLYPRSPYADYAQYMKGIISYSRDVSVIDRLMPTNIVKSDQTMMKKAYKNFKVLVERSKNRDSDYADDAKMQMVFLRNISAEHEIDVAEQYLRRGAYLAAVNRGQHVLKHYQTTPSTPLALAVMVRGYTEMKMPKLAQDARAVMDKNFPNLASTDERANHILNGNISKKRNFFSSITQGLVN